MRFVKRLSSIVITTVLVLSLGASVLAAGGGTVTDLKATLSGGKVQVTGKTSGVGVAVCVEVIKVSDESTVGSKNILIESDAFSGEIELSTAVSDPATIKVRAADYDGGTWKTVDITVESTPTPTPEPTATPTPVPTATATPTPEATPTTAATPTALPTATATPTTTPDNPVSTGESIRLMVIGTLLVIASAGIVATTVIINRRKKENL